MNAILSSTMFRLMYCIAASLSLQACASAPEVVNAETVLSKALEIRRGQGANPSRYETTVRDLKRHVRDELHGLTEKEIDDVLTLAPEARVWVVVMRLRPDPGVRGWSFIYLFTHKGELLKDHRY